MTTISTATLLDYITGLEAGIRNVIHSPTADDIEILWQLIADDWESLKAAAPGLDSLLTTTQQRLEAIFLSGDELQGITSAIGTKTTTEVLRIAAVLRTRCVAIEESAIATTGRLQRWDRMGIRELERVRDWFSITNRSDLASAVTTYVQSRPVSVTPTSTFFPTTTGQTPEAGGEVSAGSTTAEGKTTADGEGDQYPTSSAPKPSH